MSAADSLCDCNSVILPLGRRCNFHWFPCISKQALFYSVAACVSICPAFHVIGGYYSESISRPCWWLGKASSWDRACSGRAVPWTGTPSSCSHRYLLQVSGKQTSQRDVSLLHCVQCEQVVPRKALLFSQPLLVPPLITPPHPKVLGWW